MVDAVYRGNIEELLSVINYLKKYIIVFIIVLLVLLSIFHFSKYTIQIVPLITVTLVLLPAVYYTTVLVLKFSVCLLTSNRTAEAATMDADGSRRHDALKTPERPYPNSPTPPPSYEEATRNDPYQHYQPSAPPPWLPSTSSGYTSGGVVFDVQHQYRRGGGGDDAAVWAPPPPQTLTQPPTQTFTQTFTQSPTQTPPPPPPAFMRPSAFVQSQPQTSSRATAAATTIKNIPSVTVTMDDDRDGPMEI